MVFPEQNSQVQIARFVVERTHTPYRTGQLRENPPDVTTRSEPGNDTDGTPEDDGDKTRSPMPKESSLQKKMGGRVTTKTNYDEGIIDSTKPDEPDGLRRLTNDVVQRQHIIDEAVTFLRPLQKNRPTSQSIKRDPKPVNPTEIVQQQHVCPNPMETKKK